MIVQLFEFKNNDKIRIIGYSNFRIVTKSKKTNPTPDPFLKCMTVEDPNARKSSLASLQAAAKKSGETSTLL